MQKLLWFSRMSVKVLLAPLIEFTRYWERDDFGRRVAQMLIDVLVLIHLIHQLAPHVLQ